MTTERDMRHFENERSRFGNVLWKGPPLEIIRPLKINALEMKKLEFRLKPEHLPFDGDISLESLPQLEAHVRSRYAHIGLDVIGVWQDISERVYKEGRSVFDNPIEATVINHSGRPIEFVPNAKLFHLFHAPEASYIHGEELESIIGTEKDMPVCIKGEEGKDWIIARETSPATGREEARGVFLRISVERYWIPPSNVPVRVTEEGSFHRVREDLFTYILKKTDDPNYPMARDSFWVGKSSHLELADDIYVKLDHEAYALTNGSFEKVGLQTHSPLVEGGRTRHSLHSENKGDVDWIRVTVVRNGEPARQG
ncbi:MAG: hypothetical protein ACD_50C00164G0003 [uncultured bacterium]|nr:MAG: hypothetical protein ACD_50C00164G0003 [uncultured bacterium]OGH14737.1 MAG: hypothetical protein A2687_02690 [Candidatus Levybacteria bacterium RIFCSPHIGHO2_01_FULL_38_26]